MYITLDDFDFWWRAEVEVGRVLLGGRVECAGGGMGDERG